MIFATVLVLGLVFLGAVKAYRAMTRFGETGRDIHTLTHTEFTCVLLFGWILVLLNKFQHAVWHIWVSVKETRRR